VEQACALGGARLGDVDAVAVTIGPGLAGSLLVGVAAAKAYALALDRPLAGVNHLIAHVYANVLDHGTLPLPAVVFVVSGGHTSLLAMDEQGAFRGLGQTIDDAAGEAYDKVAKLLGLGYPGGPAIDRCAPDGDDRAIAFPVARMTHRDRNAPPAAREAAGLGQSPGGRTDFSFSGLKTAVKRHVGGRSSDELSPREVADICASFQRVVVEALLDRTFDVARRAGARSVGIAGGVSANSRLRRDAAARANALALPLMLPGLPLTTDNAAMIAAAGLRRLGLGRTAAWDLHAEASLPL
jgi:N6-L-threonylcarbamoyladenine synthase